MWSSRLEFRKRRPITLPRPNEWFSRACCRHRKCNGHWISKFHSLGKCIMYSLTRDFFSTEIVCRIILKQTTIFRYCPTLAKKQGWQNREMIEVYKILTGKYDPTSPSIATLIAPPGATHWNYAHIVPSMIYANTTLRLGSLLISLWNSFPTRVITAVSVDSFYKNRLDKFWANEEARFDHNANLSGSGYARCF